VLDSPPGPLEWRDAAQPVFLRLVAVIRSQIDSFGEPAAAFHRTSQHGAGEVAGTFVARGYANFSISRLHRPGGSPFPAMPYHTFAYVWFDALLGCTSPALLEPGRSRPIWISPITPGGASPCIHVLGRRTSWPLPCRLLAAICSRGWSRPAGVANGFLTPERPERGVKSIGNVLDPAELRSITAAGPRCAGICLPQTSLW